MRVVHCLFLDQAALVKDPAVSVNRTVWNPDGTLLGKLSSLDDYSWYLNIYETQGESCDG